MGKIRFRISVSHRSKSIIMKIICFDEPRDIIVYFNGDIRVLRLFYVKILNITRYFYEYLQFESKIQRKICLVFSVWELFMKFS